MSEEGEHHAGLVPESPVSASLSASYSSEGGGRVNGQSDRVIERERERKSEGREEPEKQGVFLRLNSPFIFKTLVGCRCCISTECKQKS